MAAETNPENIPDKAPSSGPRLEVVPPVRSDRPAATNLETGKWWEFAIDACGDIGSALDAGVRRARSRIRYATENYPLQVIAVAAGVAFLTGALVRVWRSNRYE